MPYSLATVPVPLWVQLKNTKADPMRDIMCKERRDRVSAVSFGHSPQWQEWPRSGCAEQFWKSLFIQRGWAAVVTNIFKLLKLCRFVAEFLGKLAYIQKVHLYYLNPVNPMQFSHSVFNLTNVSENLSNPLPLNGLQITQGKITNSVCFGVNTYLWN